MPSENEGMQEKRLSIAVAKYACRIVVLRQLGQNAGADCLVPLLEVVTKLWHQECEKRNLPAVIRL